MKHYLLLSYIFIMIGQGITSLHGADRKDDAVDDRPPHSPAPTHLTIIVAPSPGDSTVPTMLLPGAVTGPGKGKDGAAAETRGNLVPRTRVQNFDFARSENLVALSTPAVAVEASPHSERYLPPLQTPPSSLRAPSSHARQDMKEHVDMKEHAEVENPYPALEQRVSDAEGAHWNTRCMICVVIVLFIAKAILDGVSLPYHV